MHLEPMTLVDLVTGSTSRDDPRVSAHLAGCRACREDLTGLEGTWEALGAIAPPRPSTPPEDAYRELRAAVGRAQRERGRRRLHGVLRVAAAFAAVLAVGVVAQVVDDGDRAARATALVEDVERVLLLVDRGEVRIEAHAESYARIETFRAGERDPALPTIVEAGGRVSIDHRGPGPAVRLVVRVPEDTEIDLRLGRGRVDLAGIDGRARITVGRGDIVGRLRPPRDEPVTLSTREGDIDVAVPANLGSDLLLLCHGEVSSDFAAYDDRRRGAPFELIAPAGNCTLRKS